MSDVISHIKIGNTKYPILPEAYWANLLISETASSTTTPTFSAVKLGDATITFNATNSAIEFSFE